MHRPRIGVPSLLPQSNPPQKHLVNEKINDLLLEEWVEKSVSDRAENINKYICLHGRAPLTAWCWKISVMHFLHAIIVAPVSREVKEYFGRGRKICKEKKWKKKRACFLPRSLQPLLPLIAERLSHFRSSLASSSSAYRSFSPLRSRRLRANAYELKINSLVILKEGTDEEGEIRETINKKNNNNLRKNMLRAVSR